MAVSIPIFGLSPNACDTLLSTLSLRDLFGVLLISKRANELVKNYIHNRQATLRVVIGSSPTVELEDSEGGKLKWSFYHERKPERFELKDFELRILKISKENNNEKEMSIDFREMSPGIYGCQLDSMDTVLQFIEYIADLFKATVSFLCVRNSKLDDLEAIQSIKVLRKSPIVETTTKCASEENIRRVLDGFKAREQLNIACCSDWDWQPNDSYPDDKVISVRNLSIRGAAKWFTRSMLLNLKCRRIELSNTGTTDEDLNQFLLHWANSSGGKFRNLHVSRNFENEEHRECYDDIWRDRELVEQQRYDVDVIFKGLERYDVDEEPPRHKNFRMLQRETDGKMIVVVSFQTSSPEGISFEFDVRSLVSRR